MMGFACFELLVFFGDLYYIVNSSIERHHFMTYCLASSVFGHSILLKLFSKTTQTKYITLLTPDYRPHQLIHL